MYLTDRELELLELVTFRYIFYVFLYVEEKEMYSTFISIFYTSHPYIVGGGGGPNFTPSTPFSPSCLCSRVFAQVMSHFTGNEPEFQFFSLSYIFCSTTSHPSIPGFPPLVHYILSSDYQYSRVIKLGDFSHISSSLPVLDLLHFCTF